MPLSDTVILRYFSRSTSAPAAARALLKAVEGVSQVQIDESSRRVQFSYNGTYGGLVDIESYFNRSNLSASLLSHAYVILALEKREGADPAKIRAALESVPGLKRLCCVRENTADMWVDLQQASLDDLLAAAQGAQYRSQLQKHETIQLTMDAETGLDAFSRALLDVKGVLLVTRNGLQLTLKTRKTVSDGALREAAKAAGVGIAGLERR